MMADIKKTALYYPEIAIPSGRWLCQAILYFDEVSSIVPLSLDEWYRRHKEMLVQQGIPVPDEFKLRTRDLELLESAHQYRPIYPENLTWSDREEVKQLCDDFLTALLSANFQRTLGDKRGWVFDAEVYRSKGPHELFTRLVREGYAKARHDSPWLYFETSTAHLYMSILAKYLARGDHNATVPCTSHEASGFRDIAFGLGVVEEGVPVAELLFQNALPCPKYGTPMQQILAFKERRRDELLRFRQEVSSLEDSLASAERPEDAKGILSNFADKKSAALSDLHRSFSDAAFEVVMQSLQSLVEIRSPVLWLSGAAIASQASKMSDVAACSFATGAAISASIQVGVTVASGLKRHRDNMRSSAFSYLYYASKEL